MDEAKPFKIPKREVWEAFKTSEGQPGSGWSRRTIDCGVRGQPRATSTNSGIGCRQGVTFLRRYGGSTSPKRMAGRGLGHSDGRRSRRPGSRPSFLEPIWNGVTVQLLRLPPGKSAIDAVPRPASAVGATTGCSISTSRASSRPSIGKRCHRLSANIRIAHGRRFMLIVGLTAPAQMEDGSVAPRMAGTPQGGVISPSLSEPVLASRVRHGGWRGRFPHIPFERYADDAICHCQSAEEAQVLWSAIADPFWGLQAGAASGEDEDRRLQGREPAGRFSLIRISIFSGFSFEPGRRCERRRISLASTLLSCLLPVRKRRTRISRHCSAVGRCIIAMTGPSLSWPRRTTRPSAAGSPTTVTSIRRSWCSTLKRIDAYVDPTGAPELCRKLGDEVDQAAL